MSEPGYHFTPPPSSVYTGIKRNTPSKEADVICHELHLWLTQDDSTLSNPSLGGEGQLSVIRVV
jgi:hypothetical protein